MLSPLFHGYFLVSGGDRLLGRVDGWQRSRPELIACGWFTSVCRRPCLHQRAVISCKLSGVDSISVDRIMLCLPAGKPEGWLTDSSGSLDRDASQR